MPLVDFYGYIDWCEQYLKAKESDAGEAEEPTIWLD